MWYLIENGTQLPNTMSTQEVASRVAANPGATYMVWKSGMAGWVAPDTLDDFKQAAPVVPAPSQPVATPQPAVTAQAPAPQATTSPQPMAASQPVANPAMSAGSAFLGNAANQFKQIRESKSNHAFLPHLKWIDGILSWFGKKIPVDRLDTFDEFAKKWGNVGMLVSAVAVLVFGICQGIKGSGFGSAMIQAVLTMLGILIIQYVAIKFLDAGKALIEKSSTHLSSRSFLDCIGLVLILAIPGSLLGGIFAAIQAKSFLPFVFGLGASVILVYILAVTMGPETVNVSVEGDASAGQEAIALLSFSMKLSLRLVPLVFGVVNILAPIALLYFSIAILVSQAPFIYIMQGSTVIAAIFAAALFPLISYIVFLVFYLIIDVLQAILEIPNKIEDLKN